MPSIIESAWAEPFPGWIRGFRMAEPILINYGKGLLSQFPGNPEGIVDVIPVDLVVAAIVAVAAKGPADEPEVFQVASGTANIWVGRAFFIWTSVLVFPSNTNIGKVTRMASMLSAVTRSSTVTPSRSTVMVCTTPLESAANGSARMPG